MKGKWHGAPFPVPPQVAWGAFVEPGEIVDGVFSGSGYDCYVSGFTGRT